MFVCSGEATILHADLDSFYASVEQRDDPRLLGRPVIVGAGVVLAASYEAKAFGVRTAMPGRRARRSAWRRSSFRRACRRTRTRARRSTRCSTTRPLVEGMSIDEAFLDVRGVRLSGTPGEVAVKLRRAVRDRVGLPITVGIARTKFLAKVASAVAKPDGLLMVPPGRELAFLHPLPVEALWGVGRVTSAKLRARGITTVGQVACLRESTLVSLLGRASGRQLHALAHNRDPRPVHARRRRGSIGSQCATGWRRRTAEDVDAVLVGIVDRVTRRMRRPAESAARWCCGSGSTTSRATRSYTLPGPTARTEAILSTARGLLVAAAPEIQSRGLTLVGVSVANLDDDATFQLRSRSATATSTSSTPPWTRFGSASDRRP